MHRFLKRILPQFQQIKIFRRAKLRALHYNLKPWLNHKVIHSSSKQTLHSKYLYKTIRDFCWFFTKYWKWNIEHLLGRVTKSRKKVLLHWHTDQQWPDQILSRKIGFTVLPFAAWLISKGCTGYHVFMGLCVLEPVQRDPSFKNVYLWKRDNEILKKSQSIKKCWV